MSADDLDERLRELIREVPDFPKKGISFKDLTPLMAAPEAFRAAVDAMAARCAKSGWRIDRVACPEARGFIFGAALAYRLGVGMAPIRKPGKLPYKTARMEYALEYGTDAVEMHIDAVSPGQRILLVDDVLATGGTLQACVRLVEKAGGIVAGCAFVVELAFLSGRKKLEGYPVFSLVTYS